MAYPSEAELVPLQRLLRAQRTADPRAALDLAVALRDAGSPYFAAGSAAGQRLEALKGAPPGYLVHEYLHAHWQPSLFAETAATLAGAGGLRCSADDLLTLLAAELGHVDTPLKAAMADQLAPRRIVGGDVQMALGWHVAKVPGGEIVSHGGGTMGFQSFVGFGMIFTSRACSSGVIVATLPPPFFHASYDASMRPFCSTSIETARRISGRMSATRMPPARTISTTCQLAASDADTWRTRGSLLRA